MLNRCARGAGGGFTLAELIVALTLSGGAFGALAIVAARQQHVHAEIAHGVRGDAQLREGLAALTAELRSLSPLAGDISDGAALDSSIQFRATLASGAVCRVQAQSLLVTLAGFLALPEPGDTAWAYLATADEGTWAPLAITGVAARPPDTPEPCALADDLSPAAERHARLTLSLAAPVPAALDTGAPVRVTRPVRYSLYRAPDSRWYLGRREWIPALQRFETIQPVSGPYRGYAAAMSESSGLELRYFATDGGEVAPGSPDTQRIARLTITLRAPLLPVVVTPTSSGRGVVAATLAFRDRR